jgi:hypothetical protein
MQKNNILWWTMVIALLLVGFIIGWTTEPSETEKDPYIVKIHDTLKTTSVQYKLVLGTDYNIDSLITVINQFWKDSLKNLYGKGLFESKFSKVDDFGKREYTLDSRIPIDPQSSLIVNEDLKIPRRTLSLLSGINISLVGSVGLKYYMIDSKCISLSSIFSGDYLINKKSLTPNARIELEILY